MASSERLSGRRVLITGGSSGIGLTVARRLGAAGAHTVLLARGPAALAEAAASVPGCVGTVRADVSQFDAAQGAVTEAAEMLGGLDVVIAGAGAGAFGPFLEMDPGDFEQTVATTLTGLMHTARAAIPQLSATEGTLVVIGSVAGRLPVPWLAAYSSAKHGVRGFVRALDAELRAQRVPVRLALIAPGPVNTPFWRQAPTPDGRLPPAVHGAYRPDDVAAEVLAAIDGGRRLERTVGGLMLPAILVDALVPNLIQAPLEVLARLAWRNREAHQPDPADGVHHPREEARTDGGVHDRPSVLQELRRLSGPLR